LDCLGLRLRMGLGSHLSLSGLFARLGHGDGPVLHDLDAVRIGVILGLLVGILVVELEAVCLEGIQFDFVSSHVTTVYHQPATTSYSSSERWHFVWFVVQFQGMRSKLVSREERACDV
jgi:hypothetical protein